MKFSAVTLSVLCIALTLLLVFAGFSGFNASSGAPWCTYGPNYVSTGVGVTIFSITGFTLLVLSIFSALIALGQANEERMGAIICLVIGIIGLPLFWGFSFLVTFACAG